MELSHRLELNEEALEQIAQEKKSVFIFEWLRYLDKVLEVSNKTVIKECQKTIVSQLVAQVNLSPGPPTRKLLARCLATIFSIGDTFLLFETINKCNDILRSKDDSQSYLSIRLAAVGCIGAMFEKLGRMMGRSYEDTVQILTKTLKNAESQLRIEIMLTLEKITAGMGTAASNVHKDIYKSAKIGLADRSLPVRSASALCLLELSKHAPLLYTSELENLSQLCFRAFDNANYDVRCNVAKLLGTLLATSQDPPKELLKVPTRGVPMRFHTLDEALGVLLSGFLRGSQGFLKGTGEMIKGASAVSREVRVGITHAYVVFVQERGSLWLERHISTLLKHVAGLVSSPKSTGSHVECVYSRKCVTFILRSTIGRMLGEKAQAAACKDIVQVIVMEMNSVDLSGEIKEGSETSQHVLICLLQELGCLISALGTTSSPLISDTHLKLIDSVSSVLLHPSRSARLAASWCLRCCCLALPSQLHPVICRCMDRIENLKSSPEAIAGYSSSLCALLGCVQHTPLGIPHRTGKELFNLAEELLRSASQNSRLTLQRTTAGWLIIGSIMSLGDAVVRGLLPRMLLLWKNSFPRSAKEIESEKARGDVFTWQVTLEGRAGALSSMHSFLLFCSSELAKDDTVRRMLLPIESAILMLTSISNIVKQYGQHLKASTAMVRLRLYEVLSLLPQQSFESHYTSILKLLVSEFTLVESASNTTTSLLRTVCHADDSVILGPWLHETDHRYIEEQLQPNSASGSGALEHDPCFLYRPYSGDQSPPGPLPLGVSVIDASVTLFGKMFPLVANKHRLKVLGLFLDMIRAGKTSRQEAVHTNIFTAVLSALKCLAENKRAFGQDDVRKAAAELVLGGLTHPNPMLRCASGEAIGRMAQVVGEPLFVAECAQNSFDKLRSARDVVSRTGHSLALGCLHRYVGGMGSGQHLSTSISILLALAKDTTSPTVQVWSLHALSLIADSGGPMFRSYVEPSLSLLLDLILTMPTHTVEVHQCIGKCLQALITTIGPELQGDSTSIVATRWSLLCGCGLIQEHPDPIVQAEAIACIQQMHMFTPRHVNLATMVPILVKQVGSSHLVLRKAAVSCLRQLSQREAGEVCEHALKLIQDAEYTPSAGIHLSEAGLPGLLFSLLDSETESTLIQHVHHALTSMLQALATSHLGMWLTLCKEVLTSAVDSGCDNSESPSDGMEGDDDMTRFHMALEPDPHPPLPPRWPTRVFAATCLQKIIAECGSSKSHFDMALAREMQSTSHSDSDYLVLHLSELIRMGFMAATSDSDPLRLAGLSILSIIIQKFAKTPEPEFLGHVILEQYQAQVGAALRPAFAPETPSHVTSKACEVCSVWIGSGVARDLNDLRRVHQLLVSSLSKLEKEGSKTLYNESAITLEKLAILKAWAKVYAVSLQNEGIISEFNLTGPNFSDSSLKDGARSDSLLDLVKSELSSLSKYWMAALKDYAMLSLPAEFSSQLPHAGGSFYAIQTAEIVYSYYGSAWAPLMLAAALWLSNEGFLNAEKMIENQNESVSSENIKKSADELNEDQFYLLLGLCLQCLCSPVQSEDTFKSQICLQSLAALLSHEIPREIIAKSPVIAIEIATVMHRQILSSDHVDLHRLSIYIVASLAKSIQQNLDLEKKKHHAECLDDHKNELCESDLFGEGGETGEINTSQSLVYTALQVSLCALVRHLPTLAPQVFAAAPSLLASPRLNATPMKIEGLLSEVLALLVALPDLCSPAGAVAILPSILYLITGLLRECSRKNSVNEFKGESESFLSSVLDSLEFISRHPYSSDVRSEEQWCSLLQSGMSTIIQMSKTCDQEFELDDMIILKGLTQMLRYAPPSVSKPYNLQYPSINLFKKAIQHNDLRVRLKCVQCLQMLFTNANPVVSTPYIHSLSPHILEYISLSHKTVSSEIDYELLVECFNTVEMLLPRTLPQYKDEVIGLLISLLVGSLCNSGNDGNLNELLSSANKHRVSMHHHALNKLQKFGPKYPQEFKAFLQNHPDLRSKLELSILHLQQTQKDKSCESMRTTSVSKPTITLKTDFSNFV